jgi:hypothetical protein
MSSLAHKIRANKAKFGTVNRRKSGLMAFRAAAQGVTALMQNMKDNIPEVVDNISVESMPARLDVNNKMHQKVVRSFFESVDVDRSGEISVPEFINALRVIGDRLGRRFRRKDSMSLFASLDVNSDGAIDLEEMFKGVCRVNDRQLMAICYAIDACMAHEKFAGGSQGGATFQALRDAMGSETDKVLQSEYEKIVKMNKKLKKTQLQIENEKQEHAKRASLLEEEIINLRQKQVEAAKTADENRFLERRSSALQSQILEADVKMAMYEAKQQELEASTVSADDFQELKEDVEDLQEENGQLLAERERLLKTVAALNRFKGSQEQVKKEYETKLAARENLLQDLNSDREKLMMKSRRDRHDAARARKLGTGKSYIGRGKAAEEDEDYHQFTQKEALELERQVAVLKAQLTAVTPEVHELRKDKRDLVRRLEKFDEQKNSTEKHRNVQQVHINMKIMQAKVNKQEETIQSLRRHLRARAGGREDGGDRSGGTGAIASWQPESAVEESQVLKRELVAARNMIGKIADLNKRLLGKLDRLQLEHMRVSCGGSRTSKTKGGGSLGRPNAFIFWSTKKARPRPVLPIIDILIVVRQDLLCCSNGMGLFCLKLNRTHAKICSNPPPPPHSNSLFTLQMQDQLQEEKQGLSLLMSSKAVIAGLADSVGGEDKLRRIARKTSPLAKGKISVEKSNAEQRRSPADQRYTSPTVAHLQGL